MKKSHSSLQEFGQASFFPYDFAQNCLKYASFGHQSLSKYTQIICTFGQIL